MKWFIECRLLSGKSLPMYLVLVCNERLVLDHCLKQRGCRLDCGDRLRSTLAVASALALLATIRISLSDVTPRPIIQGPDWVAN